MRRRLGETLERALDLGRLRGSDPLCAVHPRTSRTTAGTASSGAARHSCPLISETSCERMNRYLDRSLVVPTLEGAGLAFFG